VLAARRLDTVRPALNEPATDARRLDLNEQASLPRRQQLGIDLADRAGHWRGPHHDPLSLEGDDLYSSLLHCQARPVMYN